MEKYAPTKTVTWTFQLTNAQDCLGIRRQPDHLQEWHSSYKTEPQRITEPCNEILSKGSMQASRQHFGCRECVSILQSPKESKNKLSLYPVLK